MTNKERNRTFLCLGVIYIITAWFSEGFHHYDEHFQLLEYVQFKLGLSASNSLAWEYNAQIRPWFQPFCLWSIESLLRLVGSTNPFTHAFIFRVFSGALGLYSSWLLVGGIRKWIGNPKLQRWCIFSSVFLWFLPYWQVRPSSEGWSASLFIIGMMTLIKPVFEKDQPTVYRDGAKKMLLAGWVLGLAFLCRYQVGIMVGGLLLWTLRYAKFPRRLWLGLFAGLLIAVVLGLFIDRWGYGNWVFTPWNYLSVNIFQGKANQFGVSPWWDYFRLTAERAGPPISLLLILALAMGWALKPRLSLTWVSLPFVLVHMLIGHKELRFLYPVAPLLPPMLFLSIENLKTRGRIQSFDFLFNRRLLVSALAVINFLYMAVACFKPARDEISFYRFVYNQNIETLYYLKKNPYVLAGVNVHYYKKPQLELIPLEGSPPQNTLVFSPESSQPFAQCKEQFNVLPKFLRKPWFINLARPIQWSAYYCS